MVGATVKENMLFRKLMGDLRLNRSGFLGVWLVFTLGMIFYNATYPAGANFMASVNRFYAEKHLADLWFDFEATSPSALTDSRAVDGIQTATGRLVVDVGLDRLGAESLVTLRLISLPAADDVNNIALLAGTLPVAPDEVILTAAFVAAQVMHLGDELRLTWSETQPPQTVRLVGIVTSAEYLIGSRGALQPFATLSTFGVGYMLPETIAAQTGMVDKINSIVVTIKVDADLTTVREALTDRLQPYNLSWISDRQQHAAYATLNANGNANSQVGLIFSLVFLFGSGAIMSVLLARQVDSERRVIGTLRALGYSRGEIVSYYLAFALIIAITGTLIGTVVGYLITAPVLMFFQQGMVGVSLPFIENAPNAVFIAFGALAGLMMALLAAVIPAWRAATTDPGLALRPPAPAGIGRLARLSLSGLPLAVRQALRNLLRTPARALSTIIGTACGLIVIVISFGSWDIIDYNFGNYYTSRKYDFIVTTNTPLLTNELKARVAEVTGVTGVETGLIAPVIVSLADRSYTALGVVLDDNSTFHTFNSIRGEPVFSQPDGAWLGHNLSRVLNAEPGDTLTVSAQGQTRAVKVLGVVQQVLGSPLYLPMSLFRQWTPLGIQPANQAYVRVDPAQRLEAQAILNALPGVIGVEDWRQTIRDIQRAADFNGNFSYIFLGFGMLLTFVVLFTTVSASVHERQTELAIMRMQGMSLGEIRLMALLETLVAVVAGLLIGILPAAGLLDFIGQSYNTDVAGNVMVIYPQTWVLAVVTLIIITLVSLLLPLRSVSRANLGDVSKSVGV